MIIILVQPWYLKMRILLNRAYKLQTDPTMKSLFFFVLVFMSCVVIFAQIVYRFMDFVWLNIKFMKQMFFGLLFRNFRLLLQKAYSRRECENKPRNKKLYSLWYFYIQQTRMQKIKRNNWVVPFVRSFSFFFVIFEIQVVGRSMK